MLPVRRRAYHRREEMLTLHVPPAAAAVAATLLKTAGAVLALGVVYPYIGTAVVHAMTLRHALP
jgi:hypothetical protein